MLTGQYTCPHCSKTLRFVPLLKRRTCPHCGHEVREWDVKPAHQQHITPAKRVPPKIVALAIVAAIIGAVVYFYLRQ